MKVDLIFKSQILIEYIEIIDLDYLYYKQLIRFVHQQQWII